MSAPPTPAGATLALDGVSMHHEAEGRRIDVLRGVSLRVEAGSSIAVVPLAIPLLTGPATMSTMVIYADKARDLQTHFAPHFALQAGGFEELAGENFDVIINATSTGLSDQALPLPTGLFAPNAVAYDMVYGKGLTPFLRQAQDAGVTRLADGLGMLVEQAAEAFALWRGVRPSTANVINTLRG